MGTKWTDSRQVMRRTSPLFFVVLVGIGCPGPRSSIAGPGAAPGSLRAGSKAKAKRTLPASGDVLQQVAHSAPASQSSISPGSRKTMPVLPTGSLSRTVIQGVVGRNMPAVTHCYERQLIKEPTLHGKVLVDLVIDRDGSVREVGVDDSTLKNAKVEACLLARIRRWVFPAPRGGIVNVKYPFVFGQKP